MGCSNSNTRPDEKPKNDDSANNKSNATRDEKRNQRKGGPGNYMKIILDRGDKFTEDNIILDVVCGVIADDAETFTYKHIKNLSELAQFKKWIPSQIPDMESNDGRKPVGNWIKNKDDILNDELYVDFNNEDIVVTYASILDKIVENGDVAVCTYYNATTVQDNEYFAYVIDGKYKSLKFEGNKGNPVIMQRITNNVKKFKNKEDDDEDNNNNNDDNNYHESNHNENINNGSIHYENNINENNVNVNINIGGGGDNVDRDGVDFEGGD